MTFSRIVCWRCMGKGGSGHSIPCVTCDGAGWRYVTPRAPENTHLTMEADHG